MRGFLKEKWVLDVKEPVSTSPIILKEDKETNIFFGTETGKLYSITTKGHLRWVFETPQSKSFFEDKKKQIINKPLFVNKTRSIVFSSEGGLVHNISLDGKLKWVFETSEEIKGSPILNDEELLIPSTNKIYFLNLEGNLKKELKTKHDITTLSVYENKLFLGTKEGLIVAMSLEGKTFWTFKTNAPQLARITIEEDYKRSFLIVPSQDNHLYALSMDGELLWSYETKGPLSSEAKISIINRKKTIVFGSQDNNVYLLTEDGELLWSYETDFWIMADPVINKGSNKSLIIVGSYDHHLYLLDAQGMFKLNCMPGLSSVVTQSGSEISSLSTEIGDEKGKLIDKLKTDSNIIGCELLSKNEVLVLTKKGKLYNIEIDLS